MAIEAPCADLLRRLALSDAATLQSLLGGTLPPVDITPLGEKTAALVRIGALIATEGSASSYQWAVDVAHAAGAEDDALVGVLLSVAPIVGIARLASAAPRLAASLGVDVDVFGDD